MDPSWVRPEYVVEFTKVDGREVPFPIEFKRGKPKLHRAD